MTDLSMELSDLSGVSLDEVEAISINPLLSGRYVFVFSDSEGNFEPRIEERTAADKITGEERRQVRITLPITVTEVLAFPRHKDFPDVTAEEMIGRTEYHTLWLTIPDEEEAGTEKYARDKERYLQDLGKIKGQLRKFGASAEGNLFEDAIPAMHGLQFSTKWTFIAEDRNGYMSKRMSLIDVKPAGKMEL